MMEWVLWPWGDVEVMELSSGQDGAPVRLGEVGGGEVPGSADFRVGAGGLAGLPVSHQSHSWAGSPGPRVPPWLPRRQPIKAEVLVSS